MESNMTEDNQPTKFREELYKLMDAFLVEAKDQSGNERSIERLNQDRHLFVQGVERLIRQKFTLERYDTQGEVRVWIQKCENLHTQQAIYSTFHDALTQVCYGCKVVRTNLKTA